MAERNKAMDQDKWQDAFRTGFFNCFSSLFAHRDIIPDDLLCEILDNPLIKHNDIEDFITSYTCNLYPGLHEYMTDYLKNHRHQKPTK